MPTYRVCFSRFPGGGVERHESSGWLMETLIKANKDERISEIVPFKINDTPITMGRNKAVHFALDQKCDYLLMLDNDMAPDLEGEQPFWDTSWEWLMQHRDVPACVCTPYSGPSPINNIYVFRYRAWNEKTPRSWSLEQFSREETLNLRGIEEVAAIPTGLCIIDCRLFNGMKRPFFYYEWKDDWADEKSSTEDVTFSRDASLAWYASGGKAGGKMYCNWSSWAGHIKTEIVGRPKFIAPDSVGASLREAVLLGLRHQPKSTVVEVDPVHGVFKEQRLDQINRNEQIWNNGDLERAEKKLAGGVHEPI